MNWKVGGAEYPVIKLSLILGTGAGLITTATGLLLHLERGLALGLGAIGGLAGALIFFTAFLADITLNALAEGAAKRARLRAASRIFLEWASGRLDPPLQTRTAIVRVNGEARRLDWLTDDDKETARWRQLLVALFQHARTQHRETKGARTGLTEVDMVGETGERMFARRDAYLIAIKVAKEIGLVDRINGVPTRLAEGWTYSKAIAYLQTAAVIPPIKDRCPPFRDYTGGRA